MQGTSGDIQKLCARKSYNDAMFRTKLNEIENKDCARLYLHPPFECVFPP